jgi:hypothetical protein
MARTLGTPPRLTWQSAERCVVSDSVFQTLRPGLFDSGHSGISMKGADFLVAKPRWAVERYADLVARLQPQHIVELGIFRGGSTALLIELARPQNLVAIDRRPVPEGPLMELILRRGLEESVRLHGEVDQADRARLSAIVGEAFNDELLDLVVDDCSHMYEATRASFNELFPRLRSGGIYVIEDWGWAHSRLGEEPLDGMLPDEVPLTRLVFELVLAIPSVSGLIADLTIDDGWISVTRGDATVDPRGFDICACSNPRGRRLLAPQ